MARTIKYAVDLGTTNSLIGKFVRGEVKVFKDPAELRATLPTVVGFRRNRILVGEPARRYLERDPQNVVERFKRRMGTSETYPIRSIDRSLTPVELSTHVLNELKTFVHTGDSVEAVVITVPASFDTGQSNATKEAGHQAGFEQVVLLQEPIAASLAYANKRTERELTSGRWLVYDLGGGTFDVALVEVNAGEMEVLDHEGDNFLGGTDFDTLIVDRILVPHLESTCAFDDLERDLKSASGRHNGLYFQLRVHAESVKKRLSTKPAADVDFRVVDDAGEEHDIFLTIRRSAFEELIRDKVDHTAEMIQAILARNKMRPSALQFVLMVGGSTYIPFVRQRIEELLDVPVNCDLDPTTAVVAGAAHYAATKPMQVEPAPDSHAPDLLPVKMAYSSSTRDDTELFAAKILGPTDGLSYRITRDDGGFDTGLRPLEERICEDLALVRDAYNFFHFKVYDDEQNLVPTDAELIEIAHGKYSVAGQPLPHDICLQYDDLAAGSTKLERVFEKGTILPTRKTTTLSLTRTLRAESEGVIKIIVREGPHYVVPEANQSIGYMEISGQDIRRDLIEGTDIEITVHLSESRELTVTAYLPLTGQEFEDVYQGTYRDVPVAHLNEEIEALSESITDEIDAATAREDYETAKVLTQHQQFVSKLVAAARRLAPDDVTDRKFQLQDAARRVAHELYGATRHKRIAELKKTYRDEREFCEDVVTGDGNDAERRLLQQIVSGERQLLDEGRELKLRAAIDRLRNLSYSILWRTPRFVAGMYHQLAKGSHRMNNPDQAKNLVDAGRIALNNENYDRLASIVSRLMDLLPHREQRQIVRGGTGIGRRS